MKKKLLKSNEEFFINDNDLKRIEKKKIKDYKIVEIPVGRIRRYLDGKLFDLYHTDAYRLLSNPKEESIRDNYEKYCKKYCYEYENRSEQRFLDLYNDLGNEDYNPQKGIIVVDQLYIIADGQHRSCILLKKYGPKHKIKVLKIICGDIGIKTYIRNFIYNIKLLITGKRY